VIALITLSRAADLSVCVLMEQQTVEDAALPAAIGPDERDDARGMFA
jgi:hypothetical protein